MQDTFRDLLKRIDTIYAKHAPYELDQNKYKVASEKQIKDLEKELGEALPEDYRAFLSQNAFGFMLEGNFTVLSLEGVIQAWLTMNTLLDEGTFDGWVEHKIAAGFRNWENSVFQKVWWSKKWLPFAQDSAGNMKCIDFAPTDPDYKYQIIAMETQDGQGPFTEWNYETFFDYIDIYTEYLEEGRFVIEKQSHDDPDWVLLAVDKSIPAGEGPKIREPF